MKHEHEPPEVTVWGRDEDRIRHEPWEIWYLAFVGALAGWACAYLYDAITGG